MTGDGPKGLEGGLTHYGDPDPYTRVLWGVFNGNPGRTRILYVFTAPERIRGASLLIHDERDPASSDAIWLYLPSFESMLRLLALFERSGSTSPKEAHQWRVRIEAREKRLALAV